MKFPKLKLPKIRVFPVVEQLATAGAYFILANLGLGVKKSVKKLDEFTRKNNGTTRKG